MKKTKKTVYVNSFTLIQSKENQLHFITKNENRITITKKDIDSDEAKKYLKYFY
jgi:hypothetical protein